MSWVISISSLTGVYTNLEFLTLTWNPNRTECLSSDVQLDPIHIFFFWDFCFYICSGYGISAQALTAVIRAHDGRGPSTMLTSSILQTLGLSSAEELIGYTFQFYNCSRHKILKAYNLMPYWAGYRVSIICLSHWKSGGPTQIHHGPALQL
jgi:hypothetical protein